VYFVNQCARIVNFDGQPGLDICAMTAFLYLIYAALGVGTWWGLTNYSELSMELSIGAGALVTAMLGQFHILATRIPKNGWMLSLLAQTLLKAQ